VFILGCGCLHISRTVYTCVFILDPTYAGQCISDIKGSYGSMWLPLAMQGVSRRALQWYSKCCCVASVTKTFTIEDTSFNILKERWTVCTPVSVNVFITLATQQHLQYHCKRILETPCIIYFICYFELHFYARPFEYQNVASTICECFQYLSFFKLYIIL
jgi:hypothetical protein